jgi:glutamyl-tRNA reductase
MSELAARHLLRSGANLSVANRTESRARELAAQVNGSIVPYQEFRSSLKDIDIVITSSGAAEYLLRKDDMKRIIEARRHRPMFLIDIAVPRNIEPEVNELEGIFLYDIDDLQRVVEENLKGRMDEAAEADRIVSEEVERLEVSLRTRSIGPVIASLQEQLERMRQAELERMRGKLGPLTPQQAQALDQLTRGIVNKIAHGPIAELRKQAGAPEGSTLVDTIRSMFRLEAEEREHAKVRGD